MTEHIKNAIFEFIKNNDGEMDRVDVVSHMGLTADKIYPLIKELIKEDKIKMEMNPTAVESGKHRLYVIVPNHEKAVEYLVGEAEFRFKVLKTIKFIDKQDSPCTISKIVKFIALDKTKIVSAIMNLHEGKAISFEGKVDDIAKITITEVGNKIFETLSKNDSCPVCQTEMEFTDIDGGIGLRCPNDCDPDMQPFYHHDKCGEKFATAKEYANHECFQKNSNPITVEEMIEKAIANGYSKEQFLEYMGAYWEDYHNNKNFHWYSLEEEKEKDQVKCPKCNKVNWSAFGNEYTCKDCGHKWEEGSEQE